MMGRVILFWLTGATLALANLPPNATSVANGNVTQFQYDALGRRTQRMLPDGSMETTAYADVPCPGNAAVNVQQTSVTDFRGKTIVTTEDVMNRLATKVLPPINPGETETTETWSYTTAGQVSSVVTSNGGVAIRSVYYDYDNLNRLVQKDTPEGVLAYSYTPDSHVQGIQGYRRSAVAVNGTITNGTVPDVSLGYAYDYAGRLWLTTNLSAGWPGWPDITETFYDNVGNLRGVLGNVMGAFYEYTSENRLELENVEYSEGAYSYAYGLDASGAQTNVSEIGGSGTRQIQYEYDHNYGGSLPPARVHRLTRETWLNGSGSVTAGITNVYDLAGNRTVRQTGFSFTPMDSITNQAFVFDHRDLIDSDNVPNNANPNYDANGNTLEDNGTNTGDLYDAENRLTARGSSIKIGYDADGNRVSKSKGGTTTYYLVDDLNPTGYAQVLAEYAATNAAPAMTYAWGLQIISEQNGSGVVHYYGLDGQGNVRFLLDTNSVVTDTYDYDAYGNLLASSGTTPNNYRYTGQQWDPDLGMYYNRARYYKPSLGRFWTMDTYEGTQSDPVSLHKYLYCAANPVNNVDPSGDDLETLAVVSIGASIGAWSAVADSVAKGQAITTTAVLQGAAVGAVFAYGGWTVKAIGVGLGIGGAVYSGLSYGPILFGSGSTAAQRGTSALLIFASIYGVDAAFRYSGVSEGGTINNCFVAGTEVAENGMEVPIEDVKVGDLVWSWDELSDSISLEPVTKTFQRRVERLVCINVGTNIIETTFEHPFWVEGKGWTRAKNLVIGDDMRTLYGDDDVVTSVSFRWTNAGVYNFEVKNSHTYFVSSESVLVHNACAIELANNMENAGIQRPPNTDPHHIVAQEDTRAEEARDILAAANVDINDVANGVFLTKNTKVTDVAGTTIHSKLHSKQYYTCLTEDLRVAAQKGQVRAALIDIGGQLKAGTYRGIKK